MFVGDDSEFIHNGGSHTNGSMRWDVHTDHTGETTQVILGDLTPFLILQASIHDGGSHSDECIPGVVHVDDPRDTMQVILHLHGTSPMFIWYSGFTV